MKLAWWILCGCLGLVVVVSVAYWARSPRMKFEHPQRGPMVEAIYALGKVKSFRHFEVKIGVMDTVLSLPVREGDFVPAGANLVRLAGGAVFRAPFAGTVTMVSVDEGGTASPQTPLIRLEDLTRNFIEVSLEQQGALRVQKGQTARILLESLRSDNLQGEVTSVFPKNDEFLAHIAVSGLQSNVLPGMTADVAIQVAMRENALLVPVAAVDNGKLVRERAGRREKISVRIGGVDGRWAEVLEGDLRPDDRVLMGALE
jgi:multidrug efflux pump subunit AcrA (membrane-fusion protein)